MKYDYDYLIVGSGLYGITSARLLTNAGYKCLIIEQRDILGGNIVDENIDGILVHKYGPHVFHTNSDEVWEFVNKYSKWNQFTFQVMAKSNNIKTYSIQYEYNPADDAFVAAQKGYSVCLLKMKIIGSYRDFENFLTDLYKYPYLVSISSYDIVPYYKNKNVLIKKFIIFTKFEIRASNPPPLSSLLS